MQRGVLSKHEGNESGVDVSIPGPENSKNKGWRVPGMMKGSKVAMGAGAGGWAPWQQVTSARSDTPVGSQEAGLWLFFFVE